MVRMKRNVDKERERGGGEMKRALEHVTALLIMSIYSSQGSEKDRFPIDSRFDK